MRDKIAVVFGFLGIFLLMFAQLVGVGYGIYLWANVLPFAQALWTAFQLWAEIIVLGTSLYVLHIFIKE